MNKKMIMMETLKKIGLVCVVVGFTGIACNNSNSSVDRAQAVNDSTALVHEDDAQFAVHAADLNMETIELAHLAEDHARDERIIAMASTVLEEHEKASNELSQISADKKITLPMAMSQDRREDVTELQTRDSIDFDRHYLDKLIDRYEEARRLYEDASNDVRDAELQAFASKHLTLIKRHEEMLKSLYDSAGYERDLPTSFPVAQDN